MLCNVDDVIVDSLEIGADLEHRRDSPQFVGKRLLSPNQLDARGFDAVPELSSLISARDDACRERSIGRLDRSDSVVQRIDHLSAPSIPRSVSAESIASWYATRSISRTVP